MQMFELQEGDRLMWIINDFDCVRPEKVPCVVVQANTETDYAIAKTDDGIGLYIDDDTIGQFERSES